MAKILLTGGAGYIGGQTALVLMDRGHDIVIIDNLSSSERSDVPEGACFIEGDIGDQETVGQVLKDHAPECVMHFAASISVPESVANPALYYKNNTHNTFLLMDACRASSVRNFIFSSTAAVYGSPTRSPVREQDALTPISPYGGSKLAAELLVRDLGAASGISTAVLRYFNVSGADPQLRRGPRDGGTHLIAATIRAVLGESSCLDIFGTDWETADGTGVRDYIHIDDIAKAHVSAYDYLRTGAESSVFNVGYGRGYSVFEVIAAVERASGSRIPTRDCPRRPGDAAVVIADSSRLKTMLNWSPRFTGIDDIVTSTWSWSLARSNHSSVGKAL